MREILFRGKVNNPDNISWLQQCVGEWVEGYLLHDPDIESYKINGFNYYSSEQGLEREPFEYRVDPETIGQYTGMKDKNGEKIFEGDIVKYSTTCEIFTVAWHGSFAEFVISELQKPNKATRGSKNMYLVNRYCEVIGNIYDNPELLEGEENE